MLLRHLVQRQPPQSVVLRAPGRTPLTYGQLASLIERTAESLAGSGIGSSDQLAIVLPNGPEMAAALANACATAPLNPAYREEEFAFYLEDLKTRALLVDKNAPDAAL